MRLIFPSGEHAPIELVEGATRIGSAGDCTVVVQGAGVAAHHCQVTLRAGSAIVRPLDAGAPTVLNGRQIAGDTAIKAGDLLLFGRVGCSVAASVARPSRAAATASAAAAEDGRTRVRATLPRYMLRGVSGSTFGKSFAVTENAVIGRQADVEIPIPAEEISRQHARLHPTAEGVDVEDLNSANGTFINDKRVHRGLLKPGEELRLDTVRFLLLTPGMDARQQSASARVGAVTAAPAAGSTSRNRPLWLVAGVLAIAAVVAAVIFAMR